MAMAIRSSPHLARGLHDKTPGAKLHEATSLKRVRGTAAATAVKVSVEALIQWIGASTGIQGHLSSTSTSLHLLSVRFCPMGLCRPNTIVSRISFRL